jgi:hypothetical protein
MMKIFSLSLSLLIVLFSVSSCIDHEVVPPPINTVNLDGSFTGYLNGTQVEFTQNVNSYLGNTSSESFVQPSPLPSRRVYMFEMASPSNPVSIRIKLGALNWDLAANTEPSLTMFNDFNTNASVTAPSYSNGAIAGFEVAYIDNTSRIWLSKQNNPVPQAVAFTNIKQQSDGTGDYSFFECNFSCYVYSLNPQTSLIDSLPIQNGKYRGWFKR